MIKTLTHHYHRVPALGKLFFGVAFLLGIFVATFKFMYAESIPFESSLNTMFTWLDTGYYSNTHFQYGGNDFVGVIFWQTGLDLSTPQEIMINSWTVNEKKIECNQQLRGIYYNNQRWRRIWPLDTWNLAILSGQWSWYDTLTMENGFFTDCTWVVWGWYIPLANEVYGQIDHNLSGELFQMFAWLSYNFTTNNISWSIGNYSFDHTLTIATWWIHSGFMFDTNWWIAELSMNLPWCWSFDIIPVFPTYIDEGSAWTFMCQGNSTSGYILSIWSWATMIYSEVSLNTGSTQIWITWQALPAWSYSGACSIIWAGQCGVQIPFQVGSWTVTSSTGCDPNFQWEITFAAITGSTVTNPWIGTYYTNTTGITLQWAATQPTSFSISWDFAESIFSWFSVWNSIFNFSAGPITLLNENDWNYFSSTFSTGACAYVDSSKRVYVDTLAPTAPNIITPTSWATVCASTWLTITRNASVDSWSQLSHYTYGVYNNSWMTTGLLLSGTLSAGTTTMNLDISTLPLGTHYINIVAVDNIGMSTTWTTIDFTSSTSYCSTNTGVVIVTPTLWLRNVDLDRVYQSDPIRVLGLTGPTLVTISKWMLFINNTTGGNGTTGMITSNDTIYIELVSSDEYDTTVSSELSILGHTGTFSLTTKKTDCILSVAEKLIIQNIYEDLKDEYNNDMTKLSDFLNTFQSMVEDESQLSNSCTLEYLLQLIEDDFNTEGIDTSNHITPNCKEYTIAYDNSESAYYSPDMKIRYYFINRESLIIHLDYYNPWDCHINSYGSNYRSASEDTMVHIAPNGKIYHLIGQYGGYSAEEFATSKYFDSLQSIKTYIDLRNPAKEIWTHSVDTMFIPIVYAAPNGKEYKIYKTNRWYMSYKLMKVRYYTTLSELKNYIDKNNPSKR